MVFPLSEGTYTVDDSKRFIPFNSSTDKLEDRPSSLVVDIVPFLLKTKNDLIIIDPGLGLEYENGDFQIHENIRRHGFSPDQITMVLLSHLHKDHAGGICYGSNQAFNLMFPKATYFCQQKELEFAFTKRNSPSYVFEKLEFLQHSPGLKFLNGDGNINPEIRYEVSGGHTPNHQVFFIQSSNKKFFFGGDVVPQSSQIIRRFIAKYDFDGKKSAQLREEYAHHGAKENWTFLFFHDGKNPIARVSEKNNRFQIEGAE
ncbi:MAG TPA: MBL fold metallo-hydrolase [Chitinophagales bacterium]|nr:MBL fold metallo-hydrolase [Chitinophagales bacterium]